MSDAAIAPPKTTHRRIPRLAVPSFEATLDAASVLGVVVLAALAGYHSYEGLRAQAELRIDPGLAATFPLLLDAVIAVATIRYILGTRRGDALQGWRWTAHGFVALTIYLNAQAAHAVEDLGWRVVAPLAYSVLVEQLGREAMRQYARTHDASGRDAIPAWLWLRHPTLCVRARIWMSRTKTPSYLDALHALDMVDAARDALRHVTRSITEPGTHEVRELASRFLRTGSLAPEAILDATGITGRAKAEITVDTLWRAITRGVIRAEEERRRIARDASTEPDARTDAPTTHDREGRSDAQDQAGTHNATQVHLHRVPAGADTGTHGSVSPVGKPGRYLSAEEKAALDAAYRVAAAATPGRKPSPAVVHEEAAKTVPSLAARNPATVSRYVGALSSGQSAESVG